MKKLRVLVTGLTGFLGAHVKPRLEEIAEVTSLSRSDPKALQADLSFWDGRIDPKALRGKFDVFLHMAGLYNLRITQREALRQNIMTTHTALAIAQKAEIKHFIHISTVGVTIRERKMMVQPEDLDDTAEFPDYYSYSKAFTEEMVRRWVDGFDSKLVLRLGILVGDRKNGAIRRIDGPYHAADALRQLQNLAKMWPGPLPLPGKSNARLPLVPVDCAADAIVRLCKISREEKWTGYKALHISPKEGLAAEKLYESVLKHLGIEKSIHLVESIPDAFLKRAAELLADLPREEVEYLLNLPHLNTAETRRVLGDDWCPEFPDYEEAFWKGYDDYVSNR